MSGFRTFKLTMAAGEEYSLPLPDSNNISCTGGDYDFTMLTDANSPFVMRKGIGVTLPVKFNTVRIINGANPQTVELYIGSGELRDSRLIAEGGSFTRGNRIVSETGYAIPNTGTVVQVLADNDNRARATIFNNGAFAFYLSSSAGITSTTGFLVPTGGYFEVTHTKAMYALRETNSTACRVMEESN